MVRDLYEAVVDGVCDYCGGEFKAGEYVAQPNGDEIVCPACVLDELQLEAS